MEHDREQARVENALHDAALRGDLEQVRQLLNRGWDVNKRISGDLTPLHEAAKKGHIRVVKLLVENGADVNTSEDVWWDTPLILAAEEGHEDVVHYLLAHGAEPYIANEAELTAMGCACVKGQLEVVRTMLDSGVNPDGPSGSVRQAYAWTPWQLAKKHHRDDIAALLAARGASQEPHERCE